MIGAASLGLDVSQQHRFDEQTRQTQKMETLGRLAGGVAHDFNNHLTVINGCADLLLLQLPPGTEVREQAEDIRDSGKRAAELTHQLLTFSRKQRIEPRPISLNRAARNAESMLRRLIREDITLHMELDSGLGFTMADPSQMDQVLLNLVVNANDAISGAGIIQVRTRGAAGTGANAGREFVVLSVEDNGCGMDEWTSSRS